MARDTIAFVSTYSHPSRDSLEAAVRRAFPQYRMENFSVGDIVARRRDWMIPNAGFVAREYGRQVLSGGLPLRVAYFRTTFLFRRLHAAMRAFIDPDRHVFSFQTQSMFDTSVPGVPHFLYTDHAHLSNLASPYFDRRMLRPPEWIELERTIYHHAARVFTRSSDVTQDIVNHYGVPAEKVVCAYSGSNVRIDPDHRPANRGYSNGRILFVGLDWERKGGPELIAAFRQVLRVHPHAHLTIVGARPDVDVRNCDVLGDLPLNEVARHYAHASVFCLPTRLEPFGSAFLDAMLHRLPVVATRVGAVPDMVIDGQTGELVPPGDAGALAQALIRMLADPARCRSFGGAGHRHAIGLYTWERVSARFRERITPLIEAPVEALSSADANLLGR